MIGFEQNLKQEIENLLYQYSGDKNSIIATKPVSGGSINEVYRLQTDSGFYILKLNDAEKFPHMFSLEAEGLAAIRQTKTIAVPNVIGTGSARNQSFLLLKNIETGPNTKLSMQNLGSQLAQLHQNTATDFGFEKDNYMGSLPQSNRKHKTWTSFFVAERLQPLVKLAFDASFIDQKLVSNFEKLYQKLNEFFDEEKPSLIHGDLWSGNYLISSEAIPYLVDPAISYGFREFDLAMTQLFGGFNADFYQAYQEAFPLQNDWQQRVDLWNLYPLLMHLNVFGLIYLEQVKRGLKKFI